MGRDDDDADSSSSDEEQFFPRPSFSPAKKKKSRSAMTSTTTQHQPSQKRKKKLAHANKQLGATHSISRTATTDEKKKNELKRPRPAFVLFAMDRRSAIAAQNPGLQLPQIQTLLGQAWREASSAEKQPYLDASALETQRYQQAKKTQKTPHAAKAPARSTPLNQTKSLVHSAEEQRAHGSTSDTTDNTLDRHILHPKQTPKRDNDGNFKRPVGRGPDGYEWDSTNGVWTSTSTSGGKVMRPKNPPLQQHDGSFSKPRGRPPDGCVWDTSKGVWRLQESSSPKQVDKSPTLQRQPEADRGLVDTRTIEKPQPRGRPPDGCVWDASKGVWRRPKKVDKSPLQQHGGSFSKPRGRPPDGCVWDSSKGVWRRQDSSSREKVGKSPTLQRLPADNRELVDNRAETIEKPQKRKQVAQPRVVGFDSSKAQRRVSVDVDSVAGDIHQADALTANVPTVPRTQKHKQSLPPVIGVDIGKTQRRVSTNQNTETTTRGTAMQNATTTTTAPNYAACGHCTNCQTETDCGTCLPCMNRQADDKSHDNDDSLVCIRRICIAPIELLPAAAQQQQPARPTHESAPPKKRPWTQNVADVNSHASSNTWTQSLTSGGLMIRPDHEREWGKDNDDDDYDGHDRIISEDV